MENSFEFVCSCGCDIEFAGQKAKELDELINNKAEQQAIIKEEERFNAHKEEFQLEVVKLLQAEGIKKEGLDMSVSSPLISDTYTIDETEMIPDDYIPNITVTDPLYEETILTKNEYSLEYQEYNNKTGKRKFVWKNPATSVLIVNPGTEGKCEEIDVLLKDVKKPLRFPNGEISEDTFRRQTIFARKGINVSVKKHFESFLRDLLACPNKRFLFIPEHAGGVKLHNGATMYISAASVIPGLEELFPSEVREHIMVPHVLPLENTAAIYRKALPNCLEAKLVTTVRDESILLPWFETEGLYPDRGFAVSYSNDNVRETAITLMKRKNYTSTVVQALTDRITKVRKELVSANDITVPFTYSGIFEEGHSLDNAFKEVIWDITGENGDECNTRKIIVLITDIPERIPEEYPVYYLNCSEDIISKNSPAL